MMKTFLGHCYATQSCEEFHVVAAVYCADRNDFEAQVAHALAQQGYQFFWSEDVLPALEWVARYPAAGGAVLARSVSEVQTVALGPLVRQASSTNPPEAEQHWLEVNELGPITPLDSQFGVDPKKSVPDALQEVMFGQPEPTEAEQAEWGDAVPPMLTYAVLDAAKMPYLLTSLLESSGLRFQSLFQGEAQEELAEHAPYLVELVDDNDFTRRLFTGSNGIGGLWEKELGIYLRSRVGFDALRKHLRKFTKVQDEEGQWFYFRFWDAQTLRILKSQFFASKSKASAFFSYHISRLAWHSGKENTFTVLCLSKTQLNSSQLFLDENMFRSFQRSVRARRVVALQSDAEALITAKDSLVSTKMSVHPKARRFYYVRLIDQMGIQNVTTTAALLSVIYLTGINVLKDPAFQYVNANRFLSPEAKARQITLGYSVVAQSIK